MLCSLFCFALAIVLFLILGKPEVSRNTYISENALMPDYARGRFNGEQRRDMDTICQRLKEAHERDSLVDAIENELLSIVGSAESIQRIRDRTISAALHAERGDGTEGLLMMAPYRTLNGSLNICGIAYVLASIRQYKKLNFWARDFAIVFPGLGMSASKDIVASIEEWLQAYHTVTEGFSGYLGAIQAGVVVELDGDQCEAPFADADLCVEGPDGLLPNLDLVNSFVTIDRHRAGQMRVFAKSLYSRRMLGLLEGGGYISSLLHLFFMMVRQAFGSPLHRHGPLLKYRIDAITVKFHQINPANATEFADRNLFEQVELGFRSLNNILEHLHQSFFFYLLQDSEHFISIASYIALGILPVVALMAVVLFVPEISLEQLKKSLALVITFVALQISTIKGLATVWERSFWGSMILLALSLIATFVASEGLCVPAQSRPVVSLLAALSLTSLVFLNFSLSVFLGLFYGPWIVLGGGNRAARIASLLLSPNSLLLMGLAGRLEWASNLPLNLTTWNAGVPFVLWHSLLISNLFVREA